LEEKMEAADKKIAQLESEVKVLKNEVQAVLLDLREKVLDNENPFNAPEPSYVTSQQIIVDRQPPIIPTPPKRAPQGDTADEKSPEDEPGPVAAKDNIEEPPEKLHEDMKTTRYAEKEPHRAFPRAINRNSDWRLNLVTIAGLARWADESLKRLGRAKTETILDISEMMGFLPSDLKQVLVKLVNTETDGHHDTSQARDFLDSLIDITALLGRNNEMETALLSIIPVGVNHG
jgi:hypothetical protein